MFERYDESADDATELMLGSGGQLIAFTSGKQAHKMACYLIGKSPVEVILTAYTFDLASLVIALCEANLAKRIWQERNPAFADTPKRSSLVAWQRQLDYHQPRDGYGYSLGFCCSQRAC